MKKTFLLMIGTAIMIAGCSSSENLSKQKAFEEETERAFKQCKEADLVVDYDGPAKLDIGLDLKTEEMGAYLVRVPKYFSFKSLSEHLDKNKIKREMVVIIISKPIRMKSPEKLKEEVDKIEEFFKAKGFKHIVVQLASATGRPIYRETKVSDLQTPPFQPEGP